MEKCIYGRKATDHRVNRRSLWYSSLVREKNIDPRNPDQSRPIQSNNEYRQELIERHGISDFDYLCASGNGHLNLLKEWPLVPDRVEIMWGNVLGKGHLDILEWMLETYPRVRNANENPRILQR